MTLVRRFRRRTYEVLEVARPGDELSRVIDSMLIFLVASNILAVVLQSMSELGAAYSSHFATFELISVTVFSVELFLRIWIAPEASVGTRGPLESRLRYVSSPLAMADIAAIAPFFLSAFFSVDLRFLRILRILRVFKLTRYSKAMSKLAEVLRMQREAFISAFVVLILVIVVSASAMYVVERDAQPEAFSSIPASMWWAVVSLTTVGYGDVIPVTTLGKLVAAAITIAGVGMVALPTSLLASGFSELHERERRQLEIQARDALADGQLTEEEKRAYSELAERLGVSEEDAMQTISLARGPEFFDRPDECPHCGKALVEP